MEEVKIEVFLKNLDELINKNKIFLKFTYEILNWEFNVLGTISNWFLSNLIKVFSQSLYSHVAFCTFYNWKLYALWAENFKWVKISEYSKNKKREIYVIKQFDINRVIYSFDEEEYANTLYFFYGDECKKNFCKRYKMFISHFSSKKYETWISLWDLIEFDLNYEMIYGKIYDIKNDLEALRSWLDNIIVENKSSNYLNKLFLTWWIFKYIVFSYGTKYDIKWVLWILFTPLKKLSFKNNWKLFCSEFVASAMLYAWFYPFNLLTKAPNMITPGDLMDPDFWIWKKEFKVLDAFTWKIYDINQKIDMRLVRKLF